MTRDWCRRGTNIFPRFRCRGHHNGFLVMLHRTFRRNQQVTQVMMQKKSSWTAYRIQCMWPTFIRATLNCAGFAEAFLLVFRKAEVEKPSWEPQWTQHDSTRKCETKNIAICLPQWRPPPSCEECFQPWLMATPWFNQSHPKPKLEWWHLAWTSLYFCHKGCRQTNNKMQHSPRSPPKKNRIEMDKRSMELWVLPLWTKHVNTKVTRLIPQQVALRCNTGSCLGAEVSWPFITPKRSRNGWNRWVGLNQQIWQMHKAPVMPSLSTVCPTSPPNHGACGLHTLLQYSPHSSTHTHTHTPSRWASVMKQSAISKAESAGS